MKRLKPGCLLRVKFPDEIFPYTDDENDIGSSYLYEGDEDILTWEGFAIETYRYDETQKQFINTDGELTIPGGTKGLLFIEEKREDDWEDGVCFYKVLYGEKECWIYYEDVAQIIKE